MEKSVRGFLTLPVSNLQTLQSHCTIAEIALDLLWSEMPRGFILEVAVLICYNRVPEYLCFCYFYDAIRIEYM